jgi:cyanate lyase
MTTAKKPRKTTKRSGSHPVENAKLVKHLPKSPVIGKIYEVHTVKGRAVQFVAQKKEGFGKFKIISNQSIR